MVDPSAGVVVIRVDPDRVVAEPFVHRLRVRYAECDAQGIVFNANYLAYIDHSITELWRAVFGGYGQMVAQGVDVVVAESRLRFASPARFDEEIDIAVTVARFGTTSMNTRHVLTGASDQTLVLDGAMRYVWVDVADGHTTPVPEWARRGLEPFLIEAA